MSKLWLGILLILFGTLSLLNSIGIISSNLYREYLNLARKYWPCLLILLGLQIIAWEKNPKLAQFLKWLLILLIGLWFFAMVFMERNWII
ncbi:MAG: hypothetical protein GXY86_11540 [Firmicutes bacterium]|nr:hypothetical protein [Bacillota bacterium]